MNVFLNLATHDTQWIYPMMESRFHFCLSRYGWSVSDAESANLHFLDITSETFENVFVKPTILFIRADTSWPIHENKQENIIGYCVPIMTTDPSSSICAHVFHGCAADITKPVFYLTTMLWHQLDVQKCYSDIKPVDKAWDVSFVGTMHHDCPSPFVKEHRANLRRAWGQLDEFSSVAIFSASVSIGSGYVIPWPEAWKIIKRSRTIVSPWGICEISWRDYEAALGGCMMIKPRQPEIKVTCTPWHDENVIYCETDYSDLADRVLESLERDESALSKISEETLATGLDFNVLAKAFAEILDEACSTST